jgi:hypothetical protein
MKYYLIGFFLFFIFETKAQSNKKRELHSNWYFKIETMDKEIIKGQLFKIDSSFVIIRDTKWDIEKDSLIAKYTKLDIYNIKKITTSNQNLINIGAISGFFLGTVIGIINASLTSSYSSGSKLITEKQLMTIMIPYISIAGGLIGSSAGLVKFKYNLNGNPNKYKKIYRKLGNKILH